MNAAVVVDTGAAPDCISEDMCIAAGINIRRNAEYLPRIRAYNGQITRPLGRALVQVKVGPVQVSVDMLVMKNMPQRILLGTRWLRKTGAVLHMEQGYITFRDYPGATRMYFGQTPSEEDEIILVAAEDFKLPANSRCYINVIVPKFKRLNAVGYRGLVKSLENCAARYGLLVGQMPISVPVGHFRIDVQNCHMTKAIDIRKGMAVAKVVGHPDELDVAMVEFRERLSRNGENDIEEVLLTVPPQMKEPLDEFREKAMAEYEQTNPAQPEAPEWVDGWPPGIKEAVQGLVDAGDITTTEMEYARQMFLNNDRRRAFSCDQDNPGMTHLVKCRIETTDERPIFVNPYRMSPKEKKACEEHVQTMLKTGIISHSQSPYGAPVLLVPKKNGKLRFCVDFRKLNAVTKRDVYPLPRIDDTLDALGGNCWFSTVDLTWGYWNIPMAPEDKHKTAFITPNGLYEFERMPFGLMNAPAIFSRMMNAVLAGLTWRDCLVYLDDIIIFGKSFEDHCDAFGRILDRIIAANLRINLEKCSLFCKEVIYLGHKVSSEGISTDPAKVDAILQWNGGRVPSNVTEVRSFVSTAGYYQKFIPRYAIITAPLTRLLHKDVPWTWGEEEQRAFELVKEKLVQAPVLAMPNFEKPFVLQTDACEYGISAILSQEDSEEDLRPIAYKSRKLIPAETNYPTHEKEALAMVWGVKKFRAYLQGVPFLALTDNNAICWLMNSAHTGKLARWALTLQEYDFMIQHIKGAQNPADGPSRMPAAEPSATSEILPPGHDVLLVMEQTAQPESRTLVTSGTSGTKQVENYANEYTVSRMNGKDVLAVDVLALVKETDQTFGASNWVQEQKRDPVLRYLYQYASLGKVVDDDKMSVVTRKEAAAKRKRASAASTPEAGEGRKHQERANEVFQGFTKRFKGIANWVTRIAKDLFIDEDEILKYRHEDKQKRVQIRIMVPKSMILKVLCKYHNDPRTGAHLGRDKMISNLTSLYFWNRMTRDIRVFVKTCEACQARKPVQPLRQGKLRIIDQEHLEAEPMVIVSIDTVGPLPTSTRGNAYILVMACHTTKYKLIQPIPDKRAQTIAWTLYRSLIRQFTIPKILISDRGTEFLGEVTQKLAELLEIDFRASTAGHHQTVTGCENFTRWLKNTITMYINQNHSDWDDDYLQEIVSCYNKVAHPTTGESPFYLMFGFQNREMPQIQYGDADLRKDLKRLRLDGLETLHKIREDVRSKLLAEGLKRKAIADRDRHDVSFEKGDWVWLWSPKKSAKKKTKKFLPTWTGPWEIVEACPDRRNLEGNALNYRIRARFGNAQVKIRLNKTEQIVHVDRLREYTRQGLEESVAPSNSVVIFQDTESFRESSSTTSSSNALRVDDHMDIDQPDQSEMVTDMSEREVMEASSSILWDRRRPLMDDKESDPISDSMSEVVTEGSSALMSLRQKPLTKELLLALIRYHLDNREEKFVSEVELLDSMRIEGRERLNAYRILRSLCVARRPRQTPICSIRYMRKGVAHFGLEATLRDRVLVDVPPGMRAMRSSVHVLFVRYVEPLLNVEM